MADLQELQRLLDKVAKEIPDKALRIIGVEGVNFIAKNFRDESFTDISAKKWDKRKTEDRKGRDITLYRTNRRGKAGQLNAYGRKNVNRAILVGFKTGGDKLKNSWDYIILSGKMVSIRSYKKYAKRHNEGTDGMPQRQMIGRSQYYDDKIKDKLTKELNKLFQ